ncbi:MAG: S1/P1 nuclease [Bdellovibrionales bacterium]|nr:S1/P1 nuclease [Bdellovibrionales bacterium]
MKKNLMCILFLLGSQAFGWGALGHRTVGLIADVNLNEKARKSVQFLLKNQSLADSANWADAIKSGLTYQQTKPYHFESIPAGMTYLQTLQAQTPQQRKKGGIIEAMLVARATLQDYRTSLNEKADALRFMAHFVGDLHQPLHTGRAADHGGNDLKVKWFGFPSSLHQVWDTGMLYTGHADIINFDMPVDTASNIYARYLVSKVGKRFVFLRTGMDTWLNETLWLRESGVYENTYATNQLKYQSKWISVADSQVLMAGLRLADMLNEIFSGFPVPGSEITLRQQIEKIVGSLTQFISLRPLGS